MIDELGHVLEKVAHLADCRVYASPVFHQSLFDRHELFRERVNGSNLLVGLVKLHFVSPLLQFIHHV